MFQAIKTSLDNKAVVSELTNKLGLGPENLIARLAIAHSISQGRKLDQKDARDAKGKVYNANVLFGEHQDLYIAIICQHYRLTRTDRNVHKYVKMHLDDGLELIAELVRENPNLLLSDFVMSSVRTGLSHLGEVSGVNGR